MGDPCLRCTFEGYCKLMEAVRVPDDQAEAARAVLVSGSTPVE